MYLFICVCMCKGVCSCVCVGQRLITATFFDTASHYRALNVLELAM